MNFTSLQLFAGAKWSWTECPTGYPAPDFSLDIIFKLGNNSAIVLNGISQADGSFDFSKISAETAALAHGSYSYQVIATDTDTLEKHLVESGTKQILPLLTTAGDTRTYAQKILDNYKDAYEKLSSREADSITLDDGSTVTFQDRSKLLGLIKRAEREIEKENGAAGPKIFKSRFV